MTTKKITWAELAKLKKKGARLVTPAGAIDYIMRTFKVTRAEAKAEYERALKSKKLRAYIVEPEPSSERRGRILARSAFQRGRRRE